MPKPRKKVKPVGKGISKAALVKATDKDYIMVFQINDAAWKAFYQSPEGKARLRKMQHLANLKYDRYASISIGGGLPDETDAQVYQKWKSTIYNTDGTVRQNAPPPQQQAPG